MSQDEKIKSLKIDSNTSNKGKDVAKFMPIVEMIARKEYGGKTGKILSYEELVNTGLIAINKLIEVARNSSGSVEYNSSYIAQSVKWAMKDELRSRQSWYGVKKVVALDKDSIDATGAKAKESTGNAREEIKTPDDARKAVFEVIMSVDSMADDTGFSVADPNGVDQSDRLELLSMKNSLKKAVSKLPDNLKKVIELRFYHNASGNEVAEKLGVSPSRISHMIKEATKKLRVLMVAEGYDSM
jgi:RNA polymerase sigma factor (sigma-70 family)